MRVVFTFSTGHEFWPPILLMTDSDESGCVNMSRCGNIVPGGGKMCVDCLDEARTRQREFFIEKRDATQHDYGEWLEENNLT